MKNKRKMVTLLAVLLIASFAAAATVDFDISGILGWLHIPFVYSYTADWTTASVGELKYLGTDNALYASVSGNAVWWDSNVASGVLLLQINDISEAGCNLIAEFNGIDYDLNSGQNLVQIPITATGQKLGIKVIAKSNARCMLQTPNDLNIAIG